MQKNDGYNDVINRYLQKIDDRKRKLVILREEAIEYYKALKKSYTK